MSAEEYCRALIWVDQTPAHVPVGRGDLPVFVPGDWLPTVVPTPDWTTQDTVFEPATGEPEPSNEETVVLYDIWVGSTRQQTGVTYEQAVAILDILSGRGTPGRMVPTEMQQPAGDDMSGNDIVDAAVDIATSYIQTRWGQQPYSGGSFRMSLDEEGKSTITGGLPGVEVIPEPDLSNCKGTPVFKKVCGQWKWVYQKRSRRKRLLTHSDAVDLAKLKGIVGQGKAMETWIATHS